MSNTETDSRYRFAMSRALSIAEAMVVLPMLGAIVPLMAGADKVVVALWVSAATLVALAACAISARWAARALVRERQRLEAERNLWRSQALNDPLTSLPNRRGILARAEHVEAGRGDVVWTVLSVDIDLFKSINDRYGHPVGDRALVLLAEVLRDTCPDDAWVGRLGGDEFVVFSDRPGLLDEAWVDGFRRTLERRELRTREGSVRLSVTIGRHVGAAGEGFSCVFDTADRHLLHGKAKRRASDAGVVIGLTDAELEAARRRMARRG